MNKTPLRPADPARLMNVGPDFTPSYLGNLGSRSVGGPRGPVSTCFVFVFVFFYSKSLISVFCLFCFGFFKFAYI